LIDFNYSLPRNKFRLLWLIIIAAGVLYFAGLGSYYLSDRDEGEYASTTAYMQKNHDYVIPKLNDKYYLEKPILVFWAILGSEHIFGDNAFALRFPGALCAFLILIFMGYFVSKITKDPDFTLLTVAAIAFMPLYAMIAKIVETDMELTLFTTISIIAFFVGTESERPRDKIWYYVSWIFMGLGFLTKGPVAPAVILPTAFFYALFRGRFWEIFKRCGIIVGIIILLVINLPWYGLAYHRLGDIFIDKFFGSQILKRGTEILLGHGGGPFFYIPVILIGAFPFSAPAIVGLFMAIKKFFRKRAIKNDSTLERFVLISALAVLLVWIVFSAAATKQPNYILPALPFLGVMVAYFWHRLFTGKKMGKWFSKIFWFIFIFLAVLWVLAGLLVPIVIPVLWPFLNSLIKPNSSEYALPLIAPVYIILPLLIAVISGVIGVYATKLFKRKEIKKMAATIAVGSFVFCAAAWILGGSVINMLQRPEVELTTALKAKLNSNTEVVTFGLWKPTLFFYLGIEKIPKYRTNHETDIVALGKLLETDKPIFVIGRKRFDYISYKVKGFNEIKCWEGYQLGGNDAAVTLWSKTSK
jgi:hypothetical protein